jgi:L-aminopeptidase/D-esterase-like protein
MVCHQFKGGIGTASRVVAEAGGATVGVLVQCNYGARANLRVGGAPVGAEIPDLLPCSTLNRPNPFGVTRPCEGAPAGSGAGGLPAGPGPPDGDQGSIIVVVATDAPLLPHQLKRLATRVSLGVGRMGGVGANPSGDIFLAFSTANAGLAAQGDRARVEALANARLDGLFQATVQATEEAILNALLAADTMTGADGHRAYALPRERLLAALRKYSLLR